MVDDRTKEEGEKGFVVKDKRFSARKEEEGPQAKEEVKREEPGREDIPEQNIPLPEINFPNLREVSTSDNNRSTRLVISG